MVPFIDLLFVLKRRFEKKDSLANIKTAKDSPNPIHDKLKLTLKDAGAAKVFIYNINGQPVHETSASQGTNQFDLQHLPNGVYTIKILNSKINTTLRFIKQ